MKTPYNSIFAIGGGSSSADSFMVKESAVIQMNICTENPAHRKSSERYKNGLFLQIHLFSIKFPIGRYPNTPCAYKVF